MCSAGITRWQKTTAEHTHPHTHMEKINIQSKVNAKFMVDEKAKKNDMEKEFFYIETFWN